MLAAIRSAAVLGIDAYDVTVEVDVALGLPQWTTVGLPASAVKESRERVGAALLNSGFTVPPRRITTNLAPADVRKEGTAFDLPIALGVLVGSGIVDAEAVARHTFVGELGLDGSVRPIRGALSIARMLSVRRDGAGDSALVLPRANVAEASLVPTLPLAAPETLAELVAWLKRGGALPAPGREAPVVASEDAVDFADVAGQESAKRALTIAAAGGHGALLIGPPGAGKTMLARRLPTILPEMTTAESLEVTAIHSVAGLLDPTLGTVVRRPFRAPHHSVSTAGLVGGGSSPRPGEVSLAHHGVLFLDELLEFPRTVLEALRQPMEDGRVVIARAAVSVAFPARFSLIAAMNPCKCGYAGDVRRQCVCAESEITNYRRKLSGPLADRIDMHVTLSPVPIGSLGAQDMSESSPAIRARVAQTRAMQRARYSDARAQSVNATAPRGLLWRDTDAGAREVLRSASESLGLSARGYDRVLRVARTIADLAGMGVISESHVAEATRYRPR